VARRVAQLSTTFQRSLIELGLQPGSSGFRAVLATVAALADADELPGVGDDETTFAPRIRKQLAGRAQRGLYAAISLGFERRLVA
jgi:hypothetical protein